MKLYFPLHTFLLYGPAKTTSVLIRKNYFNAAKSFCATTDVTLSMLSNKVFLSLLPGQSPRRRWLVTPLPEFSVLLSHMLA